MTKAMTFDRLIYIDRLKEAGLGETMARAHADALRDALLETVATKTDVAELGNALRGDVTTLRADLNSGLTGLRTDMGSALTGLRTEINSALTALRTDVTGDMTALRTETNAKFESLDRKIEITARDLVIKGAGGLIVIASLIVGLKLFG